MGNSFTRELANGWGVMTRVWKGMAMGVINGVKYGSKAGMWGTIVGAVGGAVYGAVKGSIDGVHYHRGQIEAQNNPNATSLPPYSVDSYAGYALDGSPLIFDHLGRIAGSEDGKMLNRFAEGISNGESWRSAMANSGMNRWTEANARGIAQVISRAVVSTGQVDPRLQFSLGDAIARSQALSSKRSRTGAYSYRNAQRGQGSAILGFANAMLGRQSMSGGLEGAAFHSGGTYQAQAGSGGRDDSATTFAVVR